MNSDIARYIGERWRVQSRLELQFEKLYLKLFLPRARHSRRGASKRYAGLLRGKNTDSVEFVGMEVVRRDWTALAKQVQRELYQRLFVDQPVDEYLAQIVQRVRKGELDDALVYRKNLRKDADDYTATTPPHVAAAVIRGLPAATAAAVLEMCAPDRRTAIVQRLAHVPAPVARDAEALLQNG